MLIAKRRAFTVVRIPVLAKKYICGSAVVEQFENKISRLPIQILFHTSNRSTQTTWRCSIWRNKKIAYLKNLVSLLEMELPYQCRGRLRWTTCLIRHAPTYSSDLSVFSWMSTNWRFAKRISHEAIQNLTPFLSRHSRKTSSRWRRRWKRYLPRQCLRLVILLYLMAGPRPQNISLIWTLCTLPRNMMPIL